MTKKTDNPKSSKGRPQKDAQKTPTPPKRPRGKPFMGDDGKRLTLTCRISPREAAEWKAEAEAQGISIAKYVLGFIRRERKNP